jgi:hypothetical protein
MLIDTPVMNAVQAYLLGGSPYGNELRLAGEPPSGPALPRPPHGSVRNAGARRGRHPVHGRHAARMDPAEALAHLRTAHRLGARCVLSINQEAQHAPGASPSLVHDLAREAGWTLAHRHRHWLRQGYAEELFVAG